MSAEKSHFAKPPVSTTEAKGAFFRKAGEGTFFGAQEKRSFFPAAVQPKLEVSQPDDPQEKEADAVAESVMRMSEPAAPSSGEEKQEEGVQRMAEGVQRAPMHETLHRQAGMGGFASHFPSEEPGGSTAVQAKAQGDRVATFIARSARGPPATQAKTSESHSPVHFESTLASSKGSGNPLPRETRLSMESRFGADFSEVRIHTGSQAESLSTGIQAQAFTHGNDIYFNSGKFNPGSDAGSHLLAHELTHTIQQGASQPTAQGKAARNIQRQAVSRKVHRSEAGTQRNAAVELAKAEVGKVSAKEKGPDGKRMGWERLLQYFKTTFGPDRILPEGAGFQPGCINEAQIKTESQFRGDVMGGDGTTVLHNQMRDAMPSWCGIFAFWALNKGGIPLKKWQLGSSFIPPEAAYPPEHVPQPGDIAWRREFSHYALVAGSDGTSVTTINGNTAGEDNVGGKIQNLTHPKEHWFAFFNPTLMMDGSLRNPDAEDTPGAAPVRSLAEMRKQLFNVNRKADAPAAGAEEAREDKEEKVQAKADALSRAKETAPATGGEEDPVSEGAGAGGFQSHGLARSMDTSKRVDRAAAEPTLEKEEPVQRAAEPAPKEEEKEDKEGTVHRQPMTLHNRGPPPAQPVIDARVSRRIQRWSLSGAWDAVSGAISEAASWVAKGLDKAKEWMLDKVRDFVSNIPGYKMLCLVIGSDPITGAATPLTGESLLEAGLDILPGGSLFNALFERLGIKKDIATWLQGRIEDLKSTASRIIAGFAAFWDSLSLSDIGDPDGVLTRVGNLLKSTIDEVFGFMARSATTLLAKIKEVMIREVSAFVRNRIPKAYPLLCVALGFDPQTLKDVPRNGTNILNAFLAFSDDGEEERKQMMENGTFQKAAAFIDRGIMVFSTAYVKLKAAIAGIWDFVTIENLASPIETFQKIYDSFADPIKMVLDYVIDLAAEILRLIKDAILKKLSAYARTTRGYPLLCVIIGKDPFTGQKVPRTVHNVVKGFMSLMEGGEQQYEQLKESGAIDRIVAKVEAAVDRLNMTPAAIIQLFIDLWNSFSIRDLARPLECFKRIVATFGEPIFRLIRFIIEIVLIAIEAVLILMSFPFDIVSNILAKARQAWNLIKNDPIGFFKNLLACIKQGFIQFFDNILQHLINGVVGWLMGELRDAGVPVLNDFSLMGVISWVLEVLGISMEKIWQKLAEHPRIGPEKVAKIRAAIDTLEGIWTFIKDVQERGMAAIWDKIQEQLSNLWDKVLEAVKNWIMEKIISAVVTKLLSMLDPTGIMAVINSCIAIYKAVQSFIKYITEMLKVVNSFVEGILQIAEGNIKVGADFLERSLGRAMPIVIGFLANQVGLGGIGSKIAELIGVAREMVDKAITWLVNKAVDTAFAVIDRIVSMGRSAVAAIRNWLGLEKKFTANDGKEHKVYMGGSESAPVLMVASNPTAFADFLATVVILDTDPRKAEKTAAKTAASGVAQQIDARKASRNPGETDDAKKAAVALLLNDLAIHARLLFGDVAKAGEPEVTWPSQHVTFGKSMTALKLNKAQTLKGTGPTSAANPNYAVLNRRRDPGNPEASYYVKGHLLNESIGGKGDWVNLTPLSRDGNSAHEGQVESLVKAGFHSGAVVEYQVTAHYGYGGNAGVIDAADPDRAAKLAIIAEEANVPRTLECKAWTMEEQQGGTWSRKDPIVSLGVTNEIGQSAESYKLDSSSTIMTYAELEADAKAGFTARPTETFATFRTKDKVHRDSFAQFATDTAKVDALENLFKAHFRGREKDAELATIAAMTVNDIQTWEAFSSTRSFFQTDDALRTEVKTAFETKTSSLRNAAIEALAAGIPSVTAPMTWQDYKRTQVRFKEKDGPEKDRLGQIEKSFRDHIKGLPA